MKPRAVLIAACIGLTVATSACTSSRGHVSSAAGEPVGQHGAVITVGSFDFPESVLLAEIYGGALAAGKFPVRILPNLGPREVVDPALANGLVELVPEYAGSALEFFSLGRLSATSDAEAASRVGVPFMAVLTGTSDVPSFAPYTVHSFLANVSHLPSQLQMFPTLSR